MIKLADFGKSQNRADDSKFHTKISDADWKNMKDIKPIVPLAEKVKSENVSNLNVLNAFSESNYNKHQSSTINLEIQQLERGDLVVKVSSGTESDDSMSQDVDELSGYRNQSDYGMSDSTK